MSGTAEDRANACKPAPGGAAQRFSDSRGRSGRQMPSFVSGNI
jgi:hypothetical protein